MTKTDNPSSIYLLCRLWEYVKKKNWKKLLKKYCKIKRKVYKRKRKKCYLKLKTLENFKYKENKGE